MTMMRASSQSQKIEGLTKEFPEAVVQLDRELEAAPQNAGLWFQRAALLGEERLMRDALDSLSRAIALDPFCGIYYRWRGHRHLNLAEIPEASADLTVASRLIPENWYVWYHLGLCNLILGNYDLAEKAYAQCANIPTTLSLRAALLNWQWITLMRQGRREEAAQLIEEVDASWNMDGTDNYLRLLLLYKGELTPEEAMTVPNDPEPILSVTTQGFGVANYYRVNGDMENYKKTLDRTLEVGREEAWMCFGWAAAEYERKRL